MTPRCTSADFSAVTNLRHPPPKPPRKLRCLDRYPTPTTRQDTPTQHCRRNQPAWNVETETATHPARCLSRYRSGHNGLLVGEVIKSPITDNPVVSLYDYTKRSRSRHLSADRCSDLGKPDRTKHPRQFQNLDRRHQLGNKVQGGLCQRHPVRRESGRTGQDTPRNHVSNPDRRNGPYSGTFSHRYDYCSRPYRLQPLHI